MKANESQNVEYKRSWNDECLKWVCGFINAKGGAIWIGIDDDKSVCGVAGAKKLMEDIPNKIRDEEATEGCSSHHRAGGRFPRRLSRRVPLWRTMRRKLLSAAGRLRREGSDRKGTWVALAEL